MEQGTFVKGGSILPILAHKRELSLLNAIKNNIKLEVYPDEENYAIGILYLDDGESLNHEQKNEFTLVHYFYNNDILSTEKITKTTNVYAEAASKSIINVTIYGV
jgi:alpha-glucosidase (family GH31 glycosyl hydrolase)